MQSPRDTDIDGATHQEREERNLSVVFPPTSPRPMILVPHDPDWAMEFAAISSAYSMSLGTLILRVEHVGSTAVPDLLAKPILDIDIVIPSYDVFPDVVAGLQRLGYTHNGDQGVSEREAFKPLDDSVPYESPPRTWMSHHLYVCPANSRELRRHIVFRDALRAHASLRRDYERRKLAIAQRAGGDRKLYARIKEVECREFVEVVLATHGIADQESERSQNESGGDARVVDC